MTKVSFFTEDKCLPNIFQILCKYFTVFLQTLQRDKNFDKLTGDDFNWCFLLSWPIKIRKKFHCGMLILKVKMRAGIWYPGMVGWFPFTVRPLDCCLQSDHDLKKVVSFRQDPSRDPCSCQPNLMPLNCTYTSFVKHVWGNFCGFMTI